MKLLLEFKTHKTRLKILAVTNVLAYGVNIVLATRKKVLTPVSASLTDILWQTFLRNISKSENVDACHISEAHISASKRLAVRVKKFFNKTSFWA
jgi:hypothetical protein